MCSKKSIHSKIECSKQKFLKYVCHIIECTNKKCHRFAQTFIRKSTGVQPALSKMALELSATSLFQRLNTNSLPIQMLMITGISIDISVFIVQLLSWACGHLQHIAVTICTSLLYKPGILVTTQRLPAVKKKLYSFSLWHVSY